jgi:hypothetical protein
MTRSTGKTHKPEPVWRVMIPKSDDSQRPLGVATIRYRMAQMATKEELSYLGPLLSQLLDGSQQFLAIHWFRKCFFSSQFLGYL